MSRFKPGHQSWTKGWTAEQRRAFARLGGLAVSRNPAHMSAMGKKGGASVSRDRKHMSRIGRAGGHCVSVATLAELEGRS